MESDTDHRQLGTALDHASEDQVKNRTAILQYSVCRPHSECRPFDTRKYGNAKVFVLYLIGFCRCFSSKGEILGIDGKSSASNYSALWTKKSLRTGKTTSTCDVGSRRL